MLKPFEIPLTYSPTLLSAPLFVNFAQLKTFFIATGYLINLDYLYHSFTSVVHQFVVSFIINYSDVHSAPTFAFQPIIIISSNLLNIKPIIIIQLVSIQVFVLLIDPFSFSL